jgi:hypothetical protein
MLIMLVREGSHYNNFQVKKMAAFLVAVLCSLLELYQHFRHAWCHHHQGLVVVTVSTSKCPLSWPDDGGRKYL